MASTSIRGRSSGQGGGRDRRPQRPVEHEQRRGPGTPGGARRARRARDRRDRRRHVRGDPGGLLPATRRSRRDGLRLADGPPCRERARGRRRVRRTAPRPPANRGHRRTSSSFAIRRSPRSTPRPLPRTGCSGSVREPFATSSSRASSWSAMGGSSMSTRTSSPPRPAKLPGDCGVASMGSTSIRSSRWRSRHGEPERGRGGHPLPEPDHAGRGPAGP